MSVTRHPERAATTVAATPAAPAPILLTPPDTLPEPAPAAPLSNRRIAGPAGPRRLAVLQTPSPALGAVERQAEGHIARGFSLGAKGSLFAAREEFHQRRGRVARKTPARERRP